MSKITLAIASIWLAIAFAAAAPPPIDPSRIYRPTVPPEIEERMARDQGFRKRPYVSYITLPLPSPILGAELEGYVATMILSEPQDLRFREAYEAYRERDWEYRKEHAQPLWERSAEVSAESGPITVERAQRQLQLFKDCEPVRRRIIAEEDALFDSLIDFLSEEQLFLLERVRHQRARARLRDLLRTFPGGRFDLSQALLDLSQRGFDLVPDDREAFNELRVHYDFEMTVLAENIAKARERPRTEGNLLIAQAQELLQNAEDREAVAPQARALEQRRARLFIESANLLRRLHDRNRDYARLAAARLEPETARELTRMFNESSYSPVYPNQYELTTFLEGALAHDELDVESREQIQEIERQYSAKVESLSRQMVDRLVAREEQFARSFSYHVDDLAAYQHEMLRLQRDRAKATEDALALVLSMFGDDVPEWMRDLEAERRAAWAAADRQIERQIESGLGWP